MSSRKVARIFADTGGYYVCADNLDYLDTRGKSYTTKADAMRSAGSSGYTHAIGSGTYWDGIKRIPLNLATAWQ